MHNQYKYQNRQNDNAAMQANMNQNSNPYINQSSQGAQLQQNAKAFNPYMNNAQQMQNAPAKTPYSSFFGETPSDKFLRGLLLGGAAAYLLTNENAQKSIIKAGIKIYSSLAGGVEEFKEKIMDVKAELDAEEKLD